MKRHLLLPFIITSSLFISCTDNTAQSKVAAPEPQPTPAPKPQPSPKPQQLQAEVVQRFPHDPTAFTQGLEWVDGKLLESTGIVGQSGVRWVEPATGQVLQQVPTPNSSAFGEGVNWMNGNIWHITWRAGEAYRMTPDLTVAETRGYKGEGWGITDDGNRLIMSDGTATLSFRDPLTFEETGTLKVTDGGLPVRNLNELEYAEGAIWANVWQSDRIARIDPVSGKVTGWLDVSELAREAIDKAKAQGLSISADDVTNGIAYNKATGHFYLTGKRWPLLFEVKISEVAE